MTMTQRDPEVARGRAARLERLARTAAAGGCAAGVAGALVGGILGRLAMHLLATKNPEDTGFTSDDGFTVGQVTAGGTTQLVLAAIALTMVGATVHLLVRPLLLGVGAVRVVLSSLGFGVPAAAIVVHPDGFDFSQLEPSWLAVGLFVALPVLVVAVYSTLVEWFLAGDSWFLTAPRRVVLPLLAVWLAAGFALVVVVPVFVVALLVAALVRVRLAPPVRSVLRWCGRVVLVAIAAAGAWSLATDVSAIV